MRVFVEGVGSLGPGLGGWRDSRRVLAGDEHYVHTPSRFTRQRLAAGCGAPPGRGSGQARARGRGARRSSAADATRPRRQPCSLRRAATATTCITSRVARASPEREVSPTRFHNSVHNAPAGYWSIATRSHEPSTSLCCRRRKLRGGSAGSRSASRRGQEPGRADCLRSPLSGAAAFALRPIASGFAVALVLTGAATGRGIAALDIAVEATVAKASSDE